MLKEVDIEEEQEFSVVEIDRVTLFFKRKNLHNNARKFENF